MKHFPLLEPPVHKTGRSKDQLDRPEVVGTRSVLWKTHMICCIAASPESLCLSYLWYVFTKLWMQFAFKFCGVVFEVILFAHQMFVQLWFELFVGSEDTNLPICHEKSSADMLNSGSMILQLSTPAKRGRTKPCLNFSLSHSCDKELLGTARKQNLPQKGKTYHL